MKWKKILKEVGKGIEIAAPIAAQFGVPGAQTVNGAVMLIHDNKDVPNDKAVELMAAQMEEMNKELQRLKAERGK